MKHKVDIVITITRPNEVTELLGLSSSIDLIELRADLFGNSIEITYQIKIPIIYALRSRNQGGEFNGSKTERHRLLTEA
jgi:3-dehydroquinate dehydratase